MIFTMHSHVLVSRLTRITAQSTPIRFQIVGTSNVKYKVWIQSLLTEVFNKTITKSLLKHNNVQKKTTLKTKAVKGIQFPNYTKHDFVRYFGQIIYNLVKYSGSQLCCHWAFQTIHLTNSTWNLQEAKNLFFLALRILDYKAKSKSNL